MRDQVLRARSFGRRTLAVMGAKLFLMSTLAMRLYYLQLTQSEKFKTLADENRIRLEPVLPLRGKILDRYGQIMAENQNDYKAWIDPAQTENVAETLRKIVKLLGLSQEQHAAIEKKLKDKPGQKILVAEHLNWDQVATIEVSSTELPGVTVRSVQVRSYPLEKGGSHVIGYVAAPTKSEIKNTLLLGQDDFKVGKSGIERTLEPELRGTVGIKNVEVDVHGLSVRELSVEDSIPGKDAILSLDKDLQAFAYKELMDKGGIIEGGGAVVVMDVKTGEVRALASSPGFDPNSFVMGFDNTFWSELTNHPDKPLINKAIHSEYAPGSTFKLIVALAALEKGVINSNTRQYCPGYMVFGDRRFHCWNDRGHGQLRLIDAIAQSCNVFFYKIAQDVGIDAIAAMSKHFGFSAPTNIELPSEKSGIIPTPEWKKKTLNQDWYKGETIVSSIGQGYILVTPIQMAKMVAQIANGGRVIQPTLFKKNIIIPNPTGQSIENAMTGDIQIPKEFARVPVSDAHLKLVRAGMEKVVNSPYGTARQHMIAPQKFAMAGKTGTVQVRKRMEDQKAFIPRKYRNHALFVGYAPLENPRFAISVVVEHGGSGAFAAGPVAKAVLHEAQRLQEEKGDV